MYTVLLVIHSIIVLFLIMMILIQRTDSDGMGGLGGGGGNQFLSGRTTANLMTRTTAILAGAFMISSLVLAIMAGRMSGGSILDNVPPAQTAPVEAPKPANDNAPAAPKAPEKAPEKTQAPTPAAPAVPKPE